MFNINNLVRQSQSILYEDQELIFSNSKVKWSQDSRRPLLLNEEVILKGRLQPVDPAIYQQLGFNINEYQYYRVYISDITPTQADKIRQLGASEFVCNKLKYRIVGKFDYDTNGWRELYAYLIDDKKAEAKCYEKR